MNDYYGPVLRFARSLGRAWRGSQDFRVLVRLVVLLLLGGTAFYSVVEDWNPLDAFYFSVTTLTTVGLGDLAPKTAPGKLCTVLYIFVGLGIVGGFINTLARESWSTGVGDGAEGRAEKTLRVVRIRDPLLYASGSSKAAHGCGCRSHNRGRS
jgi:hypothetical protein